MVPECNIKSHTQAMCGMLRRCDVLVNYSLANSARVAAYILLCMTTRRMPPTSGSPTAHGQQWTPRIPFPTVRQAAAAAGSSLGTTVIGTYGYMAPEQFRGAAQPASDLYALGATLLFLLAGAHFCGGFMKPPTLRGRIVGGSGSPFSTKLPPTINGVLT